MPSSNWDGALKKHPGNSHLSALLYTLSRKVEQSFASMFDSWWYLVRCLSLVQYLERTQSDHKPYIMFFNVVGTNATLATLDLCLPVFRPNESGGAGW